MRQQEGIYVQIIHKRLMAHSICIPRLKAPLYPCSTFRLKFEVVPLEKIFLSHLIQSLTP